MTYPSFGNVQGVDWVRTDSETAVSSVSADLPSGVAAGTTIVLVCVGDHVSGTLATPPGFTKELEATGGGYPLRAIFSKAAVGDETSVTVAWNGATSAAITVVALVLGGVVAFEGASHGTGGGGEQWSTPSITTTGPDRLVLHGGAIIATSGDASTPSATTLITTGNNGSASWMNLGFFQWPEAGSTAGNSRHRWGANAQNKGTYSIAAYLAEPPPTGAEISLVEGDGLYTVRAGEAFEIDGAGFGEDEGAVDIDGVNCDILSWAPTKIEAVAPLEGLMFGGSKTITVTPDSNDPGDVSGQTYLPPTGYDYVTWDGVTEAPGVFWNRETQSLIAGLAAGDQSWFKETATLVGGTETSRFTVEDGTGVVELQDVFTPGDYVNDEVYLRDATDGMDSDAYSVLVDSTPPTVVAATIDETGEVLEVELSEEVDAGDDGAAGFGLSVVDADLSYVDGIGTSLLTFSVARTINTTEVPTLAFDPPEDGLADLVGHPLAAFSGFPVTNNSYAALSVDLQFDLAGFTATTLAGSMEVGQSVSGELADFELSALAGVPEAGAEPAFIPGASEWAALAFGVDSGAAVEVAFTLAGLEVDGLPASIERGQDVAMAGAVLVELAGEPFAPESGSELALGMAGFVVEALPFSTAAGEPVAVSFSVAGYEVETSVGSVTIGQSPAFATQSYVNNVIPFDRNTGNDVHFLRRVVGFHPRECIPDVRGSDPIERAFRRRYPEFADYDRWNYEIITQALCEARGEIGKRWGPYGECTLHQRGLFAFMAHWLVMREAARKTTIAGAIPSTPGRVSGKSVGGESVSYHGGQFQAHTPGDDVLATTVYGAEFLRLRKRAGMGAMAI